MNYKEWNCTCEAGYRGNVIHCPMHAAAPKLYEALKKITELAPRDKLRLPYAIEAVEIADKALAEAEGGLCDTLYG